MHVATIKGEKCLIYPWSLLENDCMSWLFYPE